MAIMHTKMKVVSRGKGQSAVAAAAYRSGDKLVDERTGEIKYYHRKVQPETFIIAPTHAPEWVNDRQKLWNEVEKIEKNKNSQLAREVLVALPIELNEKEQNEMLKKYVQEQFVDKGMVADVCVHRDDQNNPHAHILLTVRPFNERGEWGNKKRKEYLYDEQGNKILDDKGKPKYKTHFITDWDKKENATLWRKAWANEINRVFEEKGIEQRVSHLSYEEQGIDKVPTVHLGHIASAMERKGKRTEKGDLNRNIVAYNELKTIISELEKERGTLQLKFEKEIKLESFNQSFTEEERNVINIASKYLKSKVSLSLIEKRMEQLEKWSQRIDSNKKFMNWKAETIQQAKDIYSSINRQQQIIAASEQELANIKWGNPLKYKQNKELEQTLQQRIQSAKGSIESSESNLKYHKEKLEFKTYDQLQEIEKSFKIERENTNESNTKNLKHIREESIALDNAKNALESNYVRLIAAKYPQVPEMAYIDFKTALNIGKINQQFERTLSAEEFKGQHQVFKEKVERLEPVVKNIKSSGDPTALKGLEEMQSQINQVKQIHSLLDSILAGMQRAAQQHQREPHERTKKKKRSFGLER